MKSLTQFWGKVDKASPTTFYNGTRCWEWIAAHGSDGYGSLKWNKKSERAHRVSWIVAHDEIPQGLFVLHRCDNPPCVNPAHLFLGTRRQNNADRASKGRSADGERSPKHKLTVEQVEEIRRRYSLHGKNAKSGEGSYTLARIFGVSPQSIQDIVKRVTWKK